MNDLHSPPPGSHGLTQTGEREARSRNEVVEGMGEKDRRGDAHLTAHDLAVPEGHKSNFRDIVRAVEVCDLDNGAATVV